MQVAAAAELDIILFLAVVRSDREERFADLLNFMRTQVSQS